MRTQSTEVIDDVARRRRNLESALGSLRIENLEVDGKTRATLERYVIGELTIDEVIAEVLAVDE